MRRPVVGVRVREPDVRVGQHRLQERLVALLRLADRGALALVAAEDVLLLLERGAVPGLDVHPDAARHQVRAAGHPGRAVLLRRTHTCFVSAAVVGARDVAGAVLEAHAGCAGSAPRASSTRSCRSRAGTSGPTTLPKPIRARLRIACTATCGSSAQAWTHRSPPLRALSRLSPGNCGRSTSASGRRSARPKRSFSNREGPKPIVSVSRDGLSPSASPVSSGGASARPPYAPSPTACPAVIRARGRASSP